MVDLSVRTAPAPLTPRSPARNRQDNSFATANFLGTYRGRGSQTRFRASGSIGRSDPIDVYRLNAAAGASAASSIDRFKLQKGSIRVSTFLDVGNGPQLFSRFRVSKGSLSAPTQGFSSLPTSISTYIVFDRPAQNTRYTYSLTLRPR